MCRCLAVFFFKNTINLTDDNDYMDDSGSYGDICWPEVLTLALYILAQSDHS